MKIFAKKLRARLWPAGDNCAHNVAAYIWTLAIYGVAMVGSTEIGMQPYGWDLPAWLVDLAFWAFVANVPVRSFSRCSAWTPKGD